MHVELRGVPVPLWRETQEHAEELSREFALIAAAHDTEHELPHRLTRLMQELSVRYGTFGEANEQLLQDAADAGISSVDLDYDMPASAVDGIEHLGQLLDEADDYCRRGEHLLTLAAPPQQVAFRRWFLDEFVRQIAGRPPTPWPEHAGAAR